MFRFRLQRVLDLRERKERDAATALVSAREEVDRARAHERELAEARDALAAQAAVQPGVDPAQAMASIGELRTLHYLLNRLDEHVASAATAATTAEHEADRRADDLRAAFRDRRTLDRLRERHHETWRSAAAAADRQQMDEIALTRFSQPKPTSQGS